MPTPWIISSRCRRGRLIGFMPEISTPARSGSSLKPMDVRIWFAIWLSRQLSWLKGVNEQNRIIVKASATEQGDGFLADLLNDCYDKVRQIENIEMVEDDAFENNAITGRGFCAVDIEPDPARPGEIKIPCVSILPSEIRMDPAGRKDDLSDHRFIFWHKWITLEDFAIRYPDAVDAMSDIMAGESIGDMDTGDIIGDDFDDLEDMTSGTPDNDEYSRVFDTGYYDKSASHIKVVHMEYWDVYDRYYGINPQSGELEEFEQAQLTPLQKVIPGFQYQKVPDKKVKWFQFTGHKILYDGDSPIPYDGFSIVSEVAYKDKSNSNITHFGIVKDMIDPQREANKRWSQTLNLFLAQSQGGHFIEQGAILDADHWRDTVAAPGEDTIVKDGALSGGMIKQKPMPELPVGAMQMHDLGKDLVKQVSGVNPDLLGDMSNRGEPGVVIRIRQQQGLTILAKLFKNHHRMQESLAKRVFAIIMKYMPPQQIQRILGEGKNYIFRGDLVADIKNQVVAPIRNLRDLKYNVDTDESPANMTKNMAQLATFMEMMGKGFPVDPDMVVSRMDLPESDKKQWKEYLQKSQEAATQQAQMKMQMDAQKIQGELQMKAQGLQLQAQDSAAQVNVDMQTIAQREESDVRKFGIEVSKLDMEKKKLVMDIVRSMSGGDQPKQAAVN